MTGADFPHSSLADQAKACLEQENLPNGGIDNYWSGRFLNFLDTADRFWQAFSLHCDSQAGELVRHHPSYTEMTAFVDLDLLVRAFQISPEGEGKKALMAYLRALPDLDFPNGAVSGQALENHGYVQMRAFRPPFRTLLEQWQESLKFSIEKTILHNAIPDAGEGGFTFSGPPKRL